jgi:hypothetical protein
MERLESGEAGGVIVYDLERFARQLADGERLVSAAERGLLVLDSESEYDLTKPNGKRHFREAIVAAAWYSDNLQRKVKRGKEAKALSGRVDMRRSFGFEADGITVIESEAAIIRECAARLLAGETQADLISELNERGIPSPGGARWDYTAFRQVMLRPRNTGLIVYNGKVMDGVRLPEAILDDVTFARITALYSARSRGRQPSGRYLLTGIARCERGHGLIGRAVSQRDTSQYWCKKCRNVYVDTRYLDEWAGDFAIRVLRDQAQSEALEREGAEREEQRQALLTETASIEQTLTELAARLGRQELSLQRHDAACRPLEARQADIRAELASLAAEEPEPVPARTISERDAAQVGWLEVWVYGTPGERRAMVLRALGGRRLIVGPGKPGSFDTNRVRIS